MSVCVIIPARYQSSRFPGKPLADIMGIPMIIRVVNQAKKAKLVDKVVVATDDQRIADVVTAAGESVVMTRSDHPSGTDRLAEAAQHVEQDIIINVQGDEPLIDPESIDQAINPLLDDDNIYISTLMTPINSLKDYMSPDVVKVIGDLNGNALYFSRSPIPHQRDGETKLPAGAMRHIGLYGYRKSFLKAFTELPPSFLEETEMLEQLRALENGYRIKVVEVTESAVGVDRPEDIFKVEKLLQNGAT